MNNTSKDTQSKCLVITCGFFGDILFASSIADRLKNEYQQIDYLIGFPQVKRLVQNNPNISNVYVSDIPGPYPVSILDRSRYNKVIQLKTLNYQVTPCEEFQAQAGLDNNTSTYTVFTEPLYDEAAKNLIQDLQEEHQKPVIAVLSNWEPKTYLFTEEQYKQGIDVPNLGYGGSHRNISYIINELQKHFTVYPVGVGNMNQQQTLDIPEDSQHSLLFEASVLKYCNAFVGTDGGLATIAAGVGTKTIITGDFNLQLYGWNGVLKKIEHPRLGPKEYFGDPHVVINPYATDEQVVQDIIENIK